MCQFKSGIVLKNGDLIYSPYTESHSDLIKMNDLKENDRFDFARIEFFPSEFKEYDDVEKYRLKIDEERRPDWFSVEMEEKTVVKMKSIIKRMIINDKVRNC